MPLDWQHFESREAESRVCAFTAASKEAQQRRSAVIRITAADIERDLRLRFHKGAGQSSARWRSHAGPTRVKVLLQGAVEPARRHRRESHARCLGCACRDRRARPPCAALRCSSSETRYLPDYLRPDFLQAPLPTAPLPTAPHSCTEPASVADCRKQTDELDRTSSASALFPVRLNGTMRNGDCSRAIRWPPR